MQAFSAPAHLLPLPLKGCSPLDLLRPQSRHLLRRQLHSAGLCGSLVPVRAVLICGYAVGSIHGSSSACRGDCFCSCCR
jgi:hypothetical protein